MSEVHNVVFNRKWDVYNVGDRAGFTKELADHLVNSRLAHRFEALPKARKGDPIPEAAMSKDELKRVNESKRVLKLQEEEKSRELEQQAKAGYGKKGMFPGGGKH